MPHGGKRPNAGRKSKAEELGLPALLDEVVNKKDQEAIIKKLSDKAKEGSYKHLELYLAYRYGKPRTDIDLTSKGESINDKLDLSKLSREELEQLRAITNKAGD